MYPKDNLSGFMPGGHKKMKPGILYGVDG